MRKKFKINDWEHLNAPWNAFDFSLKIIRYPKRKEKTYCTLSNEL